MEMIEHEVIVDDNIIVKLKIPEILTAMELKALSIKADKLFKLSEISMPKKSSGRPLGIAMFTDEMSKDIVTWRDNGHLGYEEIAKKLNRKYDTKLTKQSVQSRYYNVKDRIKRKNNGSE